MDKDRKERLNAYKKNYRKRNKRDASYYLRKTLKRARRLIRRKKKLIIMGGAGALVVISVVLLVWALVRGFSGSKQEEETGITAGADDLTGEAGQSETAVPVEPLQKDASPQINELVNRYFTALQEGDEETLMVLRDHTENKELLRMQENSSHIESYSNIACYTKSGVEAESYVVFAYYEVKFAGIDTSLPGITPLYAYKNAEGEYCLHDLEQEDERSARAATAASEEDVVQLYAQVSEEYQKRLQEDEALAAYLESYMNEMMAAVGEALEEQTESGNQESAEQTAGSSGGSQVPGSGMFTVTESVNVRKSASENAEKLGTCYPGEELEILMKQADGWTRVSYKGKTGYVKSDVLK